jgi:superfamily II DNA helicase RecQ
MFFAQNFATTLTTKTTRMAAFFYSTMTSTNENDLVIRSLQMLDPTLQFLTKATGQTAVPIAILHATIPSTKQIPFSHVQNLLEHGILQAFPLNRSKEQEQEFEKRWNLKQNEKSSTAFLIGFPSPDDSKKKLSGSTKTAAKRRLAALKRNLKASPASSNDGNDQQQDECEIETEERGKKDWTLPAERDPNHKEEPILEMERQARNALDQLLGLTTTKSAKTSNEESAIPRYLIPKQISYAGSNQAQGADYVNDTKDCDWAKKLHPTLLSSLLGNRRLYSHQETAIRSALQNKPTLVGTGTGSGKSLCFLVPVLQAALEGYRSLLLFPTKALAQDQIVKLQSWLTEYNLHQDIRIATLDGDTPHSQRATICQEAHLILTNPDTLHAAILPQWKHMYKPIFENIKYVVIDEAHMYQGVFGAHVAMILARLYRIASLHSEEQCEVLVFLACSATLAHPEHHFRLLCCIPQNKPVTIVTKDGSPRAAKHFWVWNPPLLDMNGRSMGTVVVPKSRRKKQNLKSSNVKQAAGPTELSSTGEEAKPDAAPRKDFVRRRHAADETALLLARAVTKGVRCIAFCKTRGLVEWVYERTLAALKQSPETVKYISKVESYRGGYSKMERRQIEQKLFQNELLGVVGTSALELGVDIGGVDLTLHCGFPSSHASLLQQAGRAGRGAASSNRPSLAICICFNSPIDQHLWRHPSSLLTRGLTAPLSMPIYPGLVQGHLLCAGQEFPLAGCLNVCTIQSTRDLEELLEQDLLCDYDLFGSEHVYQEALEMLRAQGSVKAETIAVKTKEGTAKIYKTHPSIKNPWMDVSIRSMESVNYDIVDISHPMQGAYISNHLMLRRFDFF